MLKKMEDLGMDRLSFRDIPFLVLFTTANVGVVLYLRLLFCVLVPQ